MITRRRFFGLLAAPAIVRATSIMPISVPRPDDLIIKGPNSWCDMTGGARIGPLMLPIAPLSLEQLRGVIATAQFEGWPLR